jgi:hypothetical protein
MFAQIPYEIDFSNTIEVIALSIAVGVFLGFLLSIFNMAGER